MPPRGVATFAHPPAAVLMKAELAGALFPATFTSVAIDVCPFVVQRQLLQHLPALLPCAGTLVFCSLFQASESPTALRLPRCATQLESVACSAFCTLSLVQAEPLPARPACRLGFGGLAAAAARHSPPPPPAATSTRSLLPSPPDTASLPLHNCCSSQPWDGRRTRITCCSRGCRAPTRSGSAREAPTHLRAGGVVCACVCTHVCCILFPSV